MKIKIGSRKSRLALTQSEWVKSKLVNLDCEIVHIDTKGDQVLDRALHKVGDKGLFTAELEEALLKGEIDLAVHSLKDLPTKINPQLPIKAITKREDPWDCVVFNERVSSTKSILKLPMNSVIGTSSLRRISQLRHLRPDFQFFPLRGNVETRIRKIKDGVNNLSAGVLAFAGLKRLGLQELVDEVLSCEVCIPSPGQGALAVQVCQNSIDNKPELLEALEEINHKETKILVGAERAALEFIDGGCQTPFAAYAESINSKELKLIAALGDQSSDMLIIDEIIGSKDEYGLLGEELGRRLKS
ncbi:MAG: hydroxymethylbilane synthase [Candidatus Caenarcaniphilales bacterium]|nr:hydroxymethylbilane synthase [Candidatus Caenarcaniphilales bacterium]